jgi:vitamin B12 transporter
MLNRIPLTILLLTIGLISFSQTTTVTGKVVDNKSKPIRGASITVKDTYDGGTTDSLGKFRFKTTEKGEHVIEITSLNYKPILQTIKLEGGELKLDFSMKEEFNELQAVVISAGTFEASDRKRAGVVLDPIDVVTTASANGDVTGALKTLPGAQTIGESEGLFVRGGTAAETKIFIDGTLVNNFFQSSVPNVAQFSRFSPFIFKGTVFSTGGYSALYGQALSSALILESIDFPDRTSANLGVSIIGGSGGYQHLSKKKNFAIGGGYGYTNLWPAFKIIKQKQEYSQMPEYHSGDAHFRLKTSKTGVLKYYGYWNVSRLAFTVNSLDTIPYYDKFGIKNTNFYNNFSWKEFLGKGWKVNAGISFTNNHDQIASSLQDATKNDVFFPGLEFKKFNLDLKGNYFNARLVFEKKLKGLSALRFGSEYNYFNDKSVYTASNGSKYPGTLKQNIKSAFAEADIYITNAVAAKIGTRLEHASIIDKTNIAPRLSLAYKLGNGAQASMAYGIFYQNPESRYLPSSNVLGFMKATHYIAQYLKTTKLTTFRAEVFYKKYNSLVKTDFVNGRETAINNNGFGEAKGIEFFWRDKKTIKNFDYWISYSYLDTERDYINFPYAITPNFAAKHTASVVMKKFVMPWKMQFNGAYNYASGRPYYNIGFDGTSYKFNDRGMIPDYHNFSFALNYLPFVGKQNAKTFAVYVLQVSNIFNIKQTFGYQYSYNGLRKEAIVPTSRMFVFIGAFFNFGVDRTEDVINSKLF